MKALQANLVPGWMLPLLVLWVVDGISPSLHQAEATPRLRPSQVNKEQAGMLLRPQKMAIVIGINEYRDPHWYPLRYARRDALRFGKMMRLGGFDRMISLTDKKTTTKRSLQAALLQIKRWNTSHKDTVVIYISAHGTLVSNGQQGERYIIPYDADDEQVAQTAISVSWLRQQLKRLPSTRKALILATCHTGKPMSKSRHPRGQKGHIQPSPVPYSRTMLILNAASYRYSAYESKELKADVYTHFLLDCIKQIARQRGSNARVSATEAHSCSVKRTYRYVLKHRQVRQLPGLEADVTGLEAVYLFGEYNKNKERHTPSKQTSGSLRAKGQGSLLQIPHQLLSQYEVQIYRKQQRRFQLQERFAQEGELLATLPVGQYKVTFVRRRDRRLFASTFQLKQGQRMMLAAPTIHHHVLAFSAGLTQIGPTPLRLTTATLDLNYRYWMFGLGVLYQFNQVPTGKSFGLQRLMLQLDWTWPLQLHPQWCLHLGLYTRAGVVISTLIDQPTEWISSLGMGAMAELDWWFSQRFGARISADTGIGYTPITQQSGLSWDWRARLALLWRW